MKDKYDVIENRVLLKLIPTSTTKNGIEIPEHLQKKEYEVMLVGAGKIAADGSYVKPQVVEGDKVTIMPNSGLEVTLDEQKYLLLNGDNILIVFKKAKRNTK